MSSHNISILKSLFAVTVVITSDKLKQQQLRNNSNKIFRRTVSRLLAATRVLPSDNVEGGAKQEVRRFPWILSEAVKKRKS